MRGFECGVSHTCCDANVKRHSDQKGCVKHDQAGKLATKAAERSFESKRNHGLLNHSPALSPANSSAQKPFLPFKQRGREIPAPSSTWTSNSAASIGCRQRPPPPK